MAKAGVSEDQLKVFDDHVITEHDFVKSLEAEGILLSLYSEKIPVKTKLCKNCEEPFATNYMYVAYCSDHCRARALEKIGIQWNPHKKPEERWGSEVYRNQIPIVIPPEALTNLQRLVKEIEAVQIQTDSLDVEPLVPRERTEIQIALGQALSDVYDFPGMKAQAEEELRQLDEGTHPIDRLRQMQDAEFERQVLLVSSNEKTIEPEELVENTSLPSDPPSHIDPESSGGASVFQFE